MIRKKIFLSVLLASILAPLLASAEIVSRVGDQQGIALTIYNTNLALVRDQRRVTLPSGRQTLAFREVSEKIRPETALLVAPDLQLLEQNFEYDLLTPQALVHKYVGRQVFLVKTHPTTGEEQRLKARVLSVAKGVVLQVGDHIESTLPGRLIFPDVPADLRDRPTLTMLVQSTKGGARPVELVYLTGGLSWQADYVAELAADETSLNLRGWVTLTNESGTSYGNARIQLIAGDVNQVSRERDQAMAVRAMKAPMGARLDREMKEEGLFEYHLYTLKRPTTLANRQRKQVALLGGTPVVCKKEFVLQGQSYYFRSRIGEPVKRLKVGVYVRFKNDRTSNLGLPLPAGIIRVYKQDSRGMLQFVGEDRIDHTPENETIRLKLGEAFDVTATKKQTFFKKIAGFSGYNYTYESGYEIVLKNAKEQPVVVRVLEPIPGDWAIRSESAAHQRENANLASWRLKVAAKGETTLRYRVRVSF